MSVIIKAITQS